MAIRIVLLTLLLFWFLSSTRSGFSEEYAVPHSGSPYLSLDEISDDEILHLPTGLKVTFEQMQDTLSASRVIYIGETHDNLEAHRVQIEIIKDLTRRFPGKVAVGMEMFRRSAQPELDRWHNNNLSSTEFKRLFREDWGSSYAVYQPVFDFLRSSGVPLIGLKSSKETEDRFRNEETSVRDQLPEIDFGDRYHRSFSMSVFGGHEAMEKPYRMLLLWEETMAQTVAEFLKNPAHADWKLVVLAGGFHVQYGFGIPKRAFRRIPHAYSIVLPTVTQLPPELKDREMDVEHVSIPLYAGDFAWKLQYKVLPKNRIKLGVMLEEKDRAIRIKTVGPNSNAQRAGLQKGDLLLALDEVNLLDVEDLVEKLQEKKIGDRAHLRIRRGSQELTVEVQLLETKP
ncbi:hypothetical protein UZ36_07495 [Candidatus Nitromaritima sp. SCGC AAA799-C22]|nr:hypothetical protein UZ36_07495 [Candidatus Nitromaritima sp. SCGC AAA799-C22]